MADLNIFAHDAFSMTSMSTAIQAAPYAPQLLGQLGIFTTERSRTTTVAIEEKGAPGRQAQGLYPWYEVPGRAERDLKIVCGHWSTLGLMIGHGVHAEQAFADLAQGRARQGRVERLQGVQFQ